MMQEGVAVQAALECTSCEVRYGHRMSDIHSLRVQVPKYWGALGTLKPCYLGTWTLGLLFWEHREAAIRQLKVDGGLKVLSALCLCSVVIIGTTIVQYSIV